MKKIIVIFSLSVFTLLGACSSDTPPEAKDSLSLEGVCLEAYQLTVNYLDELYVEYPQMAGYISKEEAKRINLEEFRNAEPGYCEETVQNMKAAL